MQTLDIELLRLIFIKSFCKLSDIHKRYPETKRMNVEELKNFLAKMN